MFCVQWLRLGNMHGAGVNGLRGYVTIVLMYNNTVYYTSQLDAHGNPLHFKPSVLLSMLAC